MKNRAALSIVVAATLAFPAVTGYAAAKIPPKHTSTIGTSQTTLPANLKVGEYLWVPQVSPSGPVVMVVSLPEQRAYVYRNGVLIGATTVSTGKKGNETPTGVFTILQKNQDHYSNIYNNAPMPYMQRLTWSGVALHAGRLPGYPASHGCVRMPYDFAEKLFAETKTGMTVVVSDTKQFPEKVVSPGLVAPVTSTGKVVTEPTLAGESFWRPEASTDGPVTILITNADQRMSVFRGGVEIGRTSVVNRRPDRPITLHVLTRLEPSVVGPLDPAGKPIPRWLIVSGTEETTVSTDQLLTAFSVSPDFLSKVATVTGPGTTLVVTQPAATASTRTSVETNFSVAVAEEPTAK